MIENEDHIEPEFPTAVIYWRENNIAQSRGFAGNDIGAAMSFMEALRRRRHDGAGITHVSMSTELPDDVTKKGVSDKLPEGYDWTKRRGGRRGSR